MQVQIKKITDLTAAQWWTIVRERVQAFIVERLRPFQEFDEGDLEAYHILLTDTDDQLIGYGRLLDAGNHLVMSHLFIKEGMRGQGKGQYLVNFALQTAQHLFPGKVIQVKAYAYLRPFFSKLGFTGGKSPLTSDSRYILMEYR